MSLSRIEEILSGGEVKPQSRIEQILMGEDIVPQSRIEVLLKEKLGGGGSKTVTITWDGNTEGKYSVPIYNGQAYVYKVSDEVCNNSDIVGCVIEQSDGRVWTYTQEIYDSEFNAGYITDDFAVLGEGMVIVVRKPNTEMLGTNFAEAGTYLYWASDSGATLYISSFTYTTSGSSESGGGGAEITDGIVVKARDENSDPTEVDFYGDTIADYQFGFNGYGTRCNPLSKVSKINFKNEIETIGKCAFTSCINLTGEINMPKAKMRSNSDPNDLFSGTQITKAFLGEVASVRNSMFANCANLTEVKIPKCKTVWCASAWAFKNCTSLETIELGSIGYPINVKDKTSFNSLTQANLTITVYCTSATADSVLPNIRNGATNATIILKASEDTTYNDVAYAAGETMITSTVEEEAT